MDERATRAAVLAEAGQAAVLHLATHGCLHPSDSLFSYLELADARINTADMMDLDLSCALVTLSACETGRGHIGGGDDLAGFSRSFLQAGASALILSLWRVEDQSTAQLMDTLYANLAAGRTKDEALRRAQLALLAPAGGPAALRTAHPYFWAPFVLVGDHRPLRMGEQ
jgi:CHAT domain-containing protein